MNKDIEIWAEKYRPTSLKGVILPKRLKSYFQDILKTENVPNLLLCGKPGVGKTTVAKAICNDLSCNYLLINGSDESGIDTFRSKIKDFATTVSLTGTQLKVVIIDEADYLNPSSTQPALRSFMEEYSSNCRFIFTANYKQKIIHALQSRMAVVDFSFTKEEKETMLAEFSNKVFKILKTEGVPFESEEVVIYHVKRLFPDFRKILVELQKYASINGKIDEGILGQSKSVEREILEVYKCMKEMNFDLMREWVARHIQMSTDPYSIIRSIYDVIIPKLDSVKKKENVIVILANYQAKLPYVVDYEIHMMAMLVEISLEIR